jgi:hypothetical protein
VDSGQWAHSQGGTAEGDGSNDELRRGGRDSTAP